MEKHSKTCKTILNLPRPSVTRLSALVALFALGSLMSSAKVRAECLGCPPVAWHVEVESAGETKEGYLWLSGFLAKKRIDVAAERKSNVYFEEYLKDVNMWRHALSVSHVFRGTCLEQPWLDPRKGDQPDLKVEVMRTEPCHFTLPSQHLMLIGPGEKLVGDDLLWLRDKTGVEGPVILRGPVFQVSETSALALARGPRLAVRYSPSDGLGTLVYCFSFDSGPESAELEKLCRSDPASETWPTIEGDGWLMWVDHPGT